MAAASARQLRRQRLAAIFGHEDDMQLEVFDGMRVRLIAQFHTCARQFRW
ncbi:hypothetical protein N234_26680 [Ralstonia pickettii DTP0602]|nr:hypothetical protein N234_26680 [Ralstonia pickettii DTP0602]